MDINDSNTIAAMGRQLSFFDSYFFIMTTISLVGYGSAISSSFGKILILIFICIICVVIPDLCSRLVELINSKSIYA